MKSDPFKRTKYACYYTYLATSSIFSLPPLLFVTFQEMYGISYTLLGTLVLTNFCTQMVVDLILTFFTKYFNIKKTIQLMPLLTSTGLLIYAIVPSLFPQYAYTGLLIGTIVFSISAGLCEVLLSPLEAAIPSETPDRDMSMLHSLYAYGVVTVVTLSTLFLRIFGSQNWMYLTLFWAILPIFSFVLFCIAPMPEVKLNQNAASGARKKQTGMFLCVICIFLGSAAENTMTNWISTFMENSLLIPKVVGDVLGMALFAVMLGLMRTWYAKFGKNISKVLLVGMAGAAGCYLVAGFSTNVILAFIACIATGLCTSMLWPGTLILMEEKFPVPGVAAYALMAASGDCGASVAPQLMGIVVDKVAASNWAASLSETLQLSTEQIGMKTGMLIASLFPIAGVILLVCSRKFFRKNK